MVWGAFSSCGVGRLVLVDGIMDAQQYCQIVKDNVRQSAQDLGMPRTRWVFQQDNGNFIT